MTTDRRGLTPLFWAHVLPYGEVHLDMTTRLTLTNGGRQTLREEETPGKEDQMLSEALAALAATGGTALVGAMATDAWQTARDRVLRLFGRAWR